MSDEFDDSFDDDALQAAWTRREMELDRSAGIEIRNDLASKGPLGAYHDDRRKAALDAMVALTFVSAADPLEIAKHQAVIRDYFHLRDWVRTKLESATAADETIKARRQRGR